MVMRSLPCRLAIFVLLAALTAGSALACRIPVFRYALERWPPDLFELVILHRGDLNTEQIELVQSIEARAADDTNPANLRVVTVDVGQQELSSEHRALLGAVQTDIATLEEPRMILLFPLQRRHATIAWHGELTAENVARLADSPLRQQAVERLLAGDSAVWVLIEGSDKAANDAAAATLESELAKIEELIKLPTQEILEAEEEFRADTAVELRVGFSLLRLRTDDPSEAVFRSMLLGTESDLRDFDEPIAIPIFGRGRTYYALVGKGINADLIEQNCRFICGDCSCQVKEQNPGSDVLMAVNWDDQILGTAFPDQELPELTGIGGLEVIDLGQYERELVDEGKSEENAVVAAAPAVDEADTTQPEVGPLESLALAADDQEATMSANAAPSPAETTVSISAAPPRESRPETQTPETSLLWWTLLPAVGVALIVAVAGMFLLQMRS